MKEVGSSIVAVIVWILMIGGYTFGMYKIASDDHRYTAKHVMVAAIAFPYPWWVSAKEMYRLATLSSQQRAYEEKCLDDTEAQGMPRKMRLKLCECVASTSDVEACAKAHVPSRN